MTDVDFEPLKKKLYLLFGFWKFGLIQPNRTSEKERDIWNRLSLGH